MIPYCRKVDNLGRVSLPIELRQQLGIRLGEYVDIQANNKGKVEIVKHGMSPSFRELAQNCADAIYRTTGNAVFVCSDAKIVAASGWKKSCLRQNVSAEIQKAMRGECSQTQVPVTENGPWLYALETITRDGLLVGAVIIGGTADPADTDLEKAGCAAKMAAHLLNDRV